MLETFTMENFHEVTAIGISAIIDAFVKGCPKLATIVYDHYEIEGDIVRNMLQEAGRGDVKVVTYDDWEERGPWN